MDKLTGMIILILIGLALAVALIWGATSLQEQATEYEQARGNAEAAIIRAHGQAALDRAEARAVVLEAAGQAALTQAQASIAVILGHAEANASLLSATLPWGILGILGILGLAIVALAFVLATRPPRYPVERIETRILYLPSPKASRQEFQRMIAEYQPFLLESRKDEE